MIWEGDFTSGQLVCQAKCDKQPDTEARDAVLEDAGIYLCDGLMFTDCPRCERRFEYDCDPNELYADILAGIEVMRLCGGSPRCCP